MTAQITNLTSNATLIETTDVNDSYHEVRTELQVLFDELWKVSVSCIYMSEAQRTACILWIILTYMYANVDYAPILVIDAENRGCGKSTLQQFIAVMCGYEPNERYTDFTKAGLKGISNNPVVFLDELDSISNANLKNLTNYLNTSFESNGAQAINANSCTSFFGFRCVAGIKVLSKLQPATQSRSIHIKLVQTPKNIKLAKKFSDLPMPHLKSLSDEIYTLIIKNSQKLQYYFEHVQYPQLEVLTNRFGDVWRNIFNLATLISSKHVYKLTSCVEKQSHLDSPVQFPNGQYFVKVRDFNEADAVQIYDGTDRIMMDRSTNEFITALQAVLKVHENTSSTGIQTKELFRLFSLITVKDAPVTQRMLGRHMTSLGFELNKNINKSSGFRFENIKSILTANFHDEADPELCLEYVEILEKNM